MPPDPTQSDPGQPEAAQLVQLDATAAAAESLPPLFGLNTAALSARMAKAGEPAWRGRQLAEALYRQQVAELDQITTLPKALRTRLVSDGWRVGRPAIAQVFQSVDGTERYLVQCHDNQTVETVWMPEGDNGETGDGTDADQPGAPGPGSPRTGGYPLGGPRGGGLDSETRDTTNLNRPPADSPQKSRAPSIRHLSDEWVGNHNPQPAPKDPEQGKPEGQGQRATICVSSQIGCAVNCQFCLTAKLGLQRNLTAGEIAGQVVAVFARHAVQVGRDRINLVFMGMGEPFLNYANFSAAIRLLVTEVGLIPQRMTVSTSGIVPGIELFAQEPPEFRPKLAISLNAPNDQIRSELMPINRKWPIEAVIEAVRQVQLRPRERITFEYVLLGGVTDRPQHAREVARLVRRTGLPAKVNLIAWNPGPGIAYSMPQPESVEAFRAVLAAAGIPAYLRRPRGRDIYAACGQLKRTVEG